MVCDVNEALLAAELFKLILGAGVVVLASIGLVLGLFTCGEWVGRKLARK